MYNNCILLHNFGIDIFKISHIFNHIFLQILSKKIWFDWFIIIFFIYICLFLFYIHSFLCSIQYVRELHIFICLMFLFYFKHYIMYAVVVKKRCLITDYHRFIAEHSNCSSSWVVWLQWWFFVQRSVSIKVRIRLMWTQHTAGVVSHFNGCSTDNRERETL